MSRHRVCWAVALVAVWLMAMGCEKKEVAETASTAPVVATPAPVIPAATAKAPEVSKAASESKKPAPAEGEKSGKGTSKVIIETTKGDIEVTLFPKEAPKTVERFLTLAKEGYYNDMVWHRVVPGFVIQTGLGASKPPIPDEANEHKHRAGSLAMAKPGPRNGDPARLSEPNSATTQFYIAMDKAPHLDAEFTVFGQVEKGMEVVGKTTPEDKIKTIKIVASDG